MKISTFVTRLLAALNLMSLVMAACPLWAQPGQLRWAATDRDTPGELPK